jgi:hypothetical protein
MLKYNIHPNFAKENKNNKDNNNKSSAWEKQNQRQMVTWENTTILHRW